MKTVKGAWGDEKVLIGNEVAWESDENKLFVNVDTLRDTEVIFATEACRTLFGISVAKRWDGNKFYYILTVDKTISTLVTRPEIHVITK